MNFLYRLITTRVIAPQWLMSLLFGIFLVSGVSAWAQNNVGIGTAVPNASAILELSSTTQGFLAPRMTTAQRDAISSTAASLIVYNTSTSQFEYYSGSAWVSVLSSSNLTAIAWALTGNAGTSSANFLGTTDVQPLVLKTSNITRATIAATGEVTFSSITTGIVKASNGQLSVATSGSDYESTLTFNNGLTRTANIVTLGGTLITTTTLANAGFNTSITGSGSLGLGVTTPTQKLDVLGNIQFSGALMPNSTSGTSGQVLLSQGVGVPPVWTNISTFVTTSAWSLTGNIGATSGNFLGTTDAVNLVLKTNNTTRATIGANGGIAVAASVSTTAQISLDMQAGLYNGINLYNVGSSGTTFAAISIARDPVVSANSGTGIRIGGAAGSNVNTGINITGGTGLLYNASASGSGTAIQIGSSTEPQKGLDIAAREYGIQATAITASATGTYPAVYGVYGLSQRSAIGALSYGLYATSANTNATNSGTAIGVFGSANTVGAGTHVAIGGLFNTTQVGGNRFPLVANGGGDVYLGSTNASIPSSLSGIISLGNTNTTYVHALRLSGVLSLDGDQGSIGQALISQGVGSVPVWQNIATAVTTSAWSLTGNSGLNGTNFLGTTDAQSLYFRTNNTTAATILSNGNVGFGVTTATERIDILGNLQFSGALMPNSTSGSVGQYLISRGAGTAPIWQDFPTITSSSWSLTGNSGTSSSIFLGTTDSSPLYFRTNNTTVATILSNGNVGFGITTATERVDILGNLQFSGALMPNSTSGTAGQVLVSQGISVSPVWQDLSTAITSSAWSITGNNAVSSSFFLGSINSADVSFRTANVERFRITSTGTFSFLSNSTTNIATLYSDNNNGTQLVLSAPLSSVYDYSRVSLIAPTVTWSLANKAFGAESGNFAISEGTSNPSTARFLVAPGGYVTIPGTLSVATTAVTSALNVGGIVSIAASQTTQAELRIFEPSSSGANYTALKASGQSANITYTLPDALPSTGAVLQATTTGQMSWLGNSDMSGNAGFMQSMFKYKAVKESVNNSTILQDDDDLFFSVPANTAWEISGTLLVTNANSSAEFQIAFTVPSGATMMITYFSYRGTAAFEFTGTARAGVLTSSGTASAIMDFDQIVNNVVYIKGVVVMGSTAGNIQMQWAPGTSVGSDVNVSTGSYMRAVRVQ